MNNSTAIFWFILRIQHGKKWQNWERKNSTWSMMQCYKNIFWRATFLHQIIICNNIFGLLNKKIWQRKMQEVWSSFLCHSIPICKLAKLTVKNCTLVHDLVLNENITQRKSNIDINVINVIKLNVEINEKIILGYLNNKIWGHYTELGLWSLISWPSLQILWNSNEWFLQVCYCWCLVFIFLPINIQTMSFPWST